MNSILVLKNVTTTSTVTTPANLNNILPGELVAIGDGKVVLTGAAGELQDIKRVQFFTRRDDGSIKASVPILRRAVDYVNDQVYVAPIVGVYRIGSTTAPTLPLVANEDVYVSAENKSYNHGINSQILRASAKPKTGETKTQFAQRIVDQLLNTSPVVANRLLKPFYTAAVSGTGDNIAITITMLSANTDFHLSLAGAWEGVPVTVVTAPQPGIGVGADVLAMEKDYSTNEGYSGSYALSDFWFSGKPDAVATGTYSITTIGFEGRHDTASSRYVTARITCALAYPSGATTVATKIDTLMAAIFGDAWSGTDNAEPGEGIPDDNAVNQTPLDGGA